MSGGSRFVEMVGWTVVAVGGAVMLTQAVGWAGFRTLAVAQSLTPYLALTMAPIAVVALVTRRFELAIVAVLVGVGGMILVRPLLFPADQPDVAVGAEPIRIAALNLLYTNDRIDEVAADLADRDLDVIVFSEYTAGHQKVLQQSDLADQFDYRTDRSGSGGGGVAVWSKTPVRVAPHPDTRNYSLDLEVATDDGPIRVIAVHPPTPITDFGAWHRDLATVGELGRHGDAPTALVGDFNASFWHPSMRELLDSGYTDAHAALGKGMSMSWPDDRFFPPFVMLDHALVNDRLVVTDVEDFTIAGSDHRGFVVNVAPAR